MATAAREPQWAQTEMQPLAGAPQALYGFNFHDARIADLAKKVVWLSLATFAAVIITAVLMAQSVNTFTDKLDQWCLDHDGDAYDSCKELLVDFFGGCLHSVIFFTCLCGFCVPYCGYRGATTNNRNMMSCFCGFNLLDAFIAFAWAFTLFVLYILFWAGEVLPFLLLAIYVIMLCLRAGGFWYGYKLWHHLGQGLVIITPPAYPAVVTAQLQPGYPAHSAQPGNAAYPAQPGYAAYPVATGQVQPGSQVAYQPTVASVPPMS